MVRAMWPVLSGHGTLSASRGRACPCPRRPRRPARRPAQARIVSAARNRTRSPTIWLWIALAASLLCWKFAGYSWPLCAIAVFALLAPLRGLIRGEPPHVCLGDALRDSLFDFRHHRDSRKPRRALGRRAQLVSDVRLVLRYGFVSACFLTVLRPPRGGVAPRATPRPTRRGCRKASADRVACASSDSRASRPGSFRPRCAARSSSARAAARFVELSHVIDHARRRARAPVVEPPLEPRAGCRVRREKQAVSAIPAASLNRRNSACSQLRFPATASTSSTHTTPQSRESAQRLGRQRRAGSDRSQGNVGGGSVGGRAAGLQ